MIEATSRERKRKKQQKSVAGISLLNMLKSWFIKSTPEKKQKNQHFPVNNTITIDMRNSADQNQNQVNTQFHLC